MKAFIEYAQETENVRTVTIVSNPGTENEKTESVQIPNGMQACISPNWDVEKTMTLYTDAACTQLFEGIWNVDADLTIYVKWDK